MKDDKFLDTKGSVWKENDIHGTVEDDDSKEVEEVFAETELSTRMNQSPKQNEVRHVISENNLCVCAILESYVASSRLDKLCSKVFKHWRWTSNSMLCVKGSRIILGWNLDIVDVVVVSLEDQ
ncbi:hypothetical protein Tco_0417598, partial [Tanacetum coccineum]